MSLRVREMSPSERSMVLADWKRDLALDPQRRTWGRCLTNDEFWAIIDFTIDKVAFPSCRIMVCVHDAEPDTPLAWIALRPPHVLHQYARVRLRKEPELAAAVHRELWSRVDYAVVPQTFNPIMELRR